MIAISSSNIVRIMTYTVTNFWILQRHANSKTIVRKAFDTVDYQILKIK